MDWNLKGAGVMVWTGMGRGWRGGVRLCIPLVDLMRGGDEKTNCKIERESCC